MPYTPASSAAVVESAATDAATTGRPALTLIQGGAADINGAAGATPGATAAAEAGGVASVDGAVAGTAAVPVVGELFLAGYMGVKLGNALRQIPGWDNAMHKFGGGIASTFGFAPSVSFTVADNVKFYVADRLQHLSINIAQQHAGTFSQVQGQIAHLTRLARALSVTAVAINKGARIADTLTLRQANNYTNGQALRTASYTNAKAAQTLAAANAHADAGDLKVAAHANVVAHTAQVNANAHTDSAIDTLRHELPTLISAGATAAIAVHLAPVIESIRNINARLAAVEAETEECTKPMCEDIGPKTDWGKFFHSVKTAAIFAALAELAAADVGDIESAAVLLADTLGPVLQRWMESYVGILPGGTSKSPGAVTDAIGGLPFGL